MLEPAVVRMKRTNQGHRPFWLFLVYRLATISWDLQAVIHRSSEFRAKSRNVTGKRALFCRAMIPSLFRTSKPSLPFSYRTMASAQKSTVKVSFIGAGKMAEAMSQGLRNQVRQQLLNLTS